jgi:hypothetical protein
MLQVGELFIDSKGSQTLELLKNKTITWSETGQTSVPADSPVCGFDNELCPTSKPSKHCVTTETMFAATLNVSMATDEFSPTKTNF